MYSPISPADLSKFKMIWAFITLSCIFGMAYALYSQYIGGLEPCNLCMLQRGSMTLLGGISLIALLHAPRSKPIHCIYILLADLAALSGAILAARHVWLQHLPKDQVPACGPNFDYLVGNFPIMEVIQEIFQGSGQCAEISWQLFGFSMPEVLLVVFIGLTLLCSLLFVMLFKRPKA